MAEGNIDVNVQVLEDEIVNLKGLLSEIENNPANSMEIQGEGYTKIYMEAVNSRFEGLIMNLGFLIGETVKLLENAKDGYIETDEETAQFIEEFKNEVLGNE